MNESPMKNTNQLQCMLCDNDRHDVSTGFIIISHLLRCYYMNVLHKSGGRKR